MLKSPFKLYMSNGSVKNTKKINKSNNDGGTTNYQQKPASLDLSRISTYSDGGVDGGGSANGSHDNGRRLSYSHSLPTSPVRVVSLFRRSEEFKKCPRSGRQMSCPSVTAK